MMKALPIPLVAALLAAAVSLAARGPARADDHAADLERRVAALESRAFPLADLDGTAPAADVVAAIEAAGGKDVKVERGAAESQGAIGFDARRYDLQWSGPLASARAALDTIERAGGRARALADLLLKGGEPGKDAYTATLSLVAFAVSREDAVKGFLELEEMGGLTPRRSLAKIDAYAEKLARRTAFAKGLALETPGKGWFAIFKAGGPETKEKEQVFVNVRTKVDETDAVRVYATALGIAIGWKERPPKVKGFGSSGPLPIEFWVTLEP